MSSGNRATRAKSLVKGKAAMKVKEGEQESARKSEAHRKDLVPNDLSWDAPFDLEGIPTALRERLVVLAPCLLGRAKAIYDKEFFHRVVGLCKEGLAPKEVTESMVPARMYEDDWPPGEGANKTRYLIDKCGDLRAREAYLRMYQRVYGDSPDNKAFSQTFLRACVFYHKDNGRKNKVNWAAAAAKVTEERQSHAHNNPLKLGPPALKQQLTGIVKECCQYFVQHGGLQQGGGEDTGVRKLDELLKEVRRQCIDLRGKEKALSELQEACKKMEDRKLGLEAEDERLNSLKEELRRKSKDLAKAGKVEEKARVDKEQRHITKDIAANDDKLETTQDIAAKLARSFAKDKLTYRSSEQTLELLQKKVAVERASQYSIKPKKPVGNKCLEAGVLPKIELEAPCACCSLLFVSNGAVPYSCGCVFHPWCLWPELLSGSRACPRCKKLGDPQWLESWGFDVLETPKTSPVSSSFVMRKREAGSAAQGESSAKLMRPNLSNKGPPHLAGKASSMVPHFNAHGPILPFPLLANRPCGSKYTEAIAAAISTLAQHTNELLGERKKETNKNAREDDPHPKALQVPLAELVSPHEGVSLLLEDSKEAGEELEDAAEEGKELRDDRASGKELQDNSRPQTSVVTAASLELEVKEEGAKDAEQSKELPALCLSRSTTSALEDLDALVDAM